MIYKALSTFSTIPLPTKCTPDIPFTPQTAKLTTIPGPLHFLFLHPECFAIYADSAGSAQPSVMQRGLPKLLSKLHAFKKAHYTYNITLPSLICFVTNSDLSV